MRHGSVAGLTCACDITRWALAGAQIPEDPLKIDEVRGTPWSRHGWEMGALEQRLARDPETGRFCHGDRPTVADVCLVPQVVSAERWVPTLTRLYQPSKLLTRL